MDNRHVVVALPYTSGGSVMLQLKDEGCPHYPWHWTLLGGRIEEGEKPSQTLAREMAEEIGEGTVVFARRKLLHATPYSDKCGSGMMYVFVIPLFSAGNIIIGEGAGVGLFTKEGVKGLLMTHITPPILDKFWREFDTIDDYNDSDEMVR